MRCQLCCLVNSALVYLLLATTLHAARQCRLARPKSSALSGSPNNCKAPAPGRIATTWYAGWHGSEHTPQDIRWDKYTEVIYAFAITTPDVNTVALTTQDEQLLPTFVDLAHQNNVKASLSIGGWTGSQYFSTAVASDQNRTAFVKACLDLVSKFNLDGLDFDWEYPNRQGIGCNTISSEDSSNYLAFLQELRADPVGSKITLSAAAGLAPFMGPDGTPLDDVSQFAQVFDFVTIMNYDVWGSWTPTGVGPNAPLNDTCEPPERQQGSAVRAVAAWTGANFPASKILLGVAAYGHSFRVSPSAAFSTSSPGTGQQLVSGADGTDDEAQLAAFPQFDASNQPRGDRWDGDAGVDQCGNSVPVGGIWDFWGLIDGGFLSENGTAVDGIAYQYDECSQTPYVYNPSTQVMVSYDDATSFTAKGNFITEERLAGFAMWQAGGDSNDILLDAIRSAISSTGGSAADGSGSC